MLLKAKRRVHGILDLARVGDWASRAFDVFIITLILLNVAAFILQSVRAIDSRCPGLFYGFEVFSVVVFTVEYVLRVWSCTVSPKYVHPLKGRLRFMVTPMAIIDLLAFLPFYLPFLGLDLRFIRVIRLFRLFRVAKLGRYSQAVKTFGRVLRAKKGELVIALVVLTIVLLFASSLMYYAERDAQPDEFSSIPASMWWAVCTLTTVGYGDAYPLTPLGKLAASIVAILGIGIFAMPAGILASGFVEEFESRKKKTVCPHCGKELERTTGGGAS